jgi:hypothetical protein
VPLAWRKEVRHEGSTIHAGKIIGFRAHEGESGSLAEQPEGFIVMRVAEKANEDLFFLTGFSLVRVFKSPLSARKPF